MERLLNREGKVAAKNDAAFLGSFTHTNPDFKFCVWWGACVSGEGFFWSLAPAGEPHGPFPTAEGAFLSAIKD